MFSTTISPRQILTLGTLTYTVLLFLAVVFYQERTIFADIAFHTFTILKTKTFFIQNNRFGAFFSQLFPLGARALHLPLKSVLLAYSTGFVVLYGAVFYLLHRMKQFEMAMAMLLFSTLIVAETFFWIQSELPQGIAFTLLTFGFILSKNQLFTFRPWQIALLFGMLLTVIWFHPMLLFVLVFLLIFLKDRIESNLWKSIIWFCGLVIVFKNLVLPRAEYDLQAMGRAKNLLTLFPNYFNLQSNKDFLHWCLTDYGFLIILFGINVVFYFLKRNFFKLALQMAFFLGYLFFINVSFNNGDHQFYIENLYLPLSIFVAIPFVFDVLNTGFLKKTPLILVSCLLIFATTRIYMHAAHWTARLDWNKNLLVQTVNLPNKKLLIDEKKTPKDLMVMTWGSSFEFLLLSSLEKPENARCILVDENPSRLNWAKNTPNTLLTEWEVWKYNELPQRYFVPRDTGAYSEY
jgi:hypothetical protein